MQEVCCKQVLKELCISLCKDLVRLREVSIALFPKVCETANNIHLSFKHAKYPILFKSNKAAFSSSNGGIMCPLLILRKVSYFLKL